MTRTRAHRLGPLAALLLSACLAPSPAPVVRGPLPTLLPHPLAALTLGFRPRRAATQPAGTTGLLLAASYANLFSKGAAGPIAVSVDGELAGLSLLVRHGLGARADLEVELPVHYATGGFLDPAIEGFHALFSLPNAERELSPEGDFHVRLEAAGDPIYRLEDERLELSDVPLVLTLGSGPPGTAPEARWRGALRLGVELPLGSQARGFGNGGVDLGAAALFERSRGRWTQHASLAAVRVAQPDAFEAAGVRLEDYAELLVAHELRADDRTSWVLQLALRSPLVEDLDIEVVDDPILDLGLGLVRDLGPRARLFASFHEDLISHAGPDLAFQAGWSFGL